MKVLISSTIRTFIHGESSFGTLHLRGVYVPAAHEEVKGKESILEAPMDQTNLHPEMPTAQALSSDTANVNVSVSGSALPTSVQVKCIDATSVPNELHAFVQFDLPPGCSVLPQAMAGQITALVLRVLDEMEDLPPSTPHGQMPQQGSTRDHAEFRSRLR